MGAEASLWELVGSPCPLGHETPHQNEQDPKPVPIRLFISLCSQEWLRPWLAMPAPFLNEAWWDSGGQEGVP